MSRVVGAGPQGGEVVARASDDLLLACVQQPQCKRDTPGSRCNGESAQVTFDRGETECKWDIRATYEDGDVTDARDVNLCEVATVTLTP